MKKKKVWGILLLVTVTLTGCTDSRTAEETVIELQEDAWNAPQTVEVTRGDLESALVLDAQVGPMVEQLSFKEEGAFGEFCVKLGEEVKAGDVLALAASEDIEEEIEEKEKAIQELTRDYEYQKATMENDIEIMNLQLKELNYQLLLAEEESPWRSSLSVQVARQREEKKRKELELRQLTETYELELSQGEEQLQKMIEKSAGNVIRAPFDGVVVALAQVEYKENINTDLYYVAVADTGTCYVRCEYTGQTMLNSATAIRFWKNGKEYEAAAVPMDEKIYWEMKKSGSIYSQFVITAPDEELHAGDYGKLELIMVEKEDVLLLPELAVAKDTAGDYVYMDVDGNRQRVSVKTGSRDGIRVEILEGLQEGDVVYVQE